MEEIWAHLLEKGMVDQVERGACGEKFQKIFCSNHNKNSVVFTYIYIYIFHPADTVLTLKSLL